MGLIFGIFSLAYALGQTPWGVAADRFGSRLIIAGSILCWSGFTTFTGLARSFVSMLAIRFSFGGLEAALSPSTAVAFTRWTPVTERSTAFGVFLSGGRLGAALTPPLAVLLMLRFGWRAMFVIIGLLGIPAALVWLFWFRDDPAAHASVNSEERELLAPNVAAAATRERVSWPALLRSSRLWNLLAVSFTTTFLWQFYITWFPTYLIEKRGLPLKEAAFYAGLPFLFGVAGAWVGGIGTDFLTRRVGVRRARLWVGCVGLDPDRQPDADRSALASAAPGGAGDGLRGIHGRPVHRGYLVVSGRNRRRRGRGRRRSEQRRVQLRRLCLSRADGNGASVEWKLEHASGGGDL